MTTTINALAARTIRGTMLAVTLGLAAAVAIDAAAIAQTTPAPAPAPAPAKPAAAPAKPAAPAATPAAPAKPAAPAAAPAKPAAPAAAEAPAPAEPSADQNPWVKICNTDPATKREICLTTQEQRAETGQLLVSVALREISGEARKVLLLAVPPAMLLQPGLRIQVDKGKQEEGKYSICFANACYAEMVAADAFIAGMKKGNQLIVTTLNQQGKPVSFPLQLPGFKTSHEGKPVDTQALAKQQQELQSELAKRAEEARQKLVDEQKKAATKAQ
ncbi:MAG: invasion associated locus B family protein [Hyphomicrobiaceae bacterium]|nr:invasion associated locus B family protein [Hyphomicrobiaceae bacterium]